MPLLRLPRSFWLSHARSPDQITRELDTYELMQLLDYGGGDTFDSALLAASQGADRRACRALSASLCFATTDSPRAASQLFHGQPGRSAPA